MQIIHPQQLKNIYNERRIYSVEDLYKIIEPIQMLKNSTSGEYFEFYRGHSLNSYKLESGLVRLENNIESLTKIENILYERFKNDFVPKKLSKLELTKLYRGKISYETDWKLLFQAQHLGLKTRLLDWSIKWEIALLFAVENSIYHNMDGVFWIFFCPIQWRYNDSRKSEYLDKSPFNIEDFYLINQPFYLGPNFNECIGQMRQIRQYGRFSIQPLNKSIIPLELQPDIQNYLIKVIVDGNSKAKIKNELANQNWTIDWAYYRRDTEIEETLKTINLESYKLD